MKVIITDDTFVSWAGHSAEYNFAIYDELERRGINCQIFAHNKVSQIKGLLSRAKPTFTHTASKVPCYGKILPRLIYKLAGAFFTNASHFLDLLRKITSSVDDKDILIVGDFSLRTSLAYSIWLFYLTVLRKRLSVVVLVHGAPLYRCYYWELFFFKLLARFHRITLATLNKAIANVCSKQTSLKCMIFPIPQTSRADAFHVCQSGNHSEVALAFLGLSTIEKGFDVLVDEIDLLRDSLNQRKITLTIQCNIASDSPRLNKVKDKLCSLVESIVGLKAIEGALSAEGFLDVLCSSDILIFPYRPDAYKYIQSGVFTQALALGKVVIVTKDTFIASELERCGSGIIYEYGVPGALAEAIMIAVGDIGVMKAKAQEAKDLYYQLHNPKHYVDLLLALKLLPAKDIAFE